MRAAGWSLPVLALLTAPALAGKLSVTVTDSAGAPIPEAVVYAMPLSGRMPSTAPRAAVIDQINKEFVPFVVPVQIGAAVTFPNKDNIRHHVYSFSPAKIFDLKLYSGVPAKPVIMEKAGPVALGCNIHDWMVGYVYVVESPWFTKTAKSGTASLDLTDGEYDIRTWHPWQHADVPATRVKVNGAEVRVSFRIDLNPPPKVTAH